MQSIFLKAAKKSINSTMVLFRGYLRIERTKELLLTVIDFSVKQHGSIGNYQFISRSFRKMAPSFIQVTKNKYSIQFKNS